MFYILYVLLGMFVGICFGYSAGVKNGLEKGYKSAIFYMVSIGKFMEKRAKMKEKLSKK